MLRNWAGNVTFSTSTLHRPTSIEQLQQLVASSASLRALGTGHSFSRVADSDGALVTVAGLPAEVRVDGDVVDVPAGVRFGELALALHAAGRALPNLGSLPHISVAGACATGTHGSGGTHHCLAAGATAVEFVAADGSLVRPDDSDPDFAGAVLALGAVGVMTGLRLRTVPAFDVRQDVWLDLPWPALVEHADEILDAGYSVSVFDEFRRPGVIDKVWVKTRLPGTPADVSQWGATAAATPQNPVTGHDPDAATPQLGEPGPWHERLPHFRLEYTPSNGHEQQSEYLVPRALAAEALEAFGAVGPSLRPALEVAEVRTVAADQLWLSPAHDRDTLALHVTWADDDALVQPALARLEAVLAPFAPRPHWGKVFALDPGEVRGHYPRLDDFRTLVARYDPDRTFANAFLDRYVY